LCQQWPIRYREGWRHRALIPPSVRSMKISLTNFPTHGPPDVFDWSFFFFLGRRRVSTPPRHRYGPYMTPFVFWTYRCYLQAAFSRRELLLPCPCSPSEVLTLRLRHDFRRLFSQPFFQMTLHVSSFHPFFYPFLGHILETSGIVGVFSSVGLPFLPLSIPSLFWC